MTEAIIRTLKTAQDQVKNRSGTFSTDYLLGEGLHPHKGHIITMLTQMPELADSWATEDQDSGEKNALEKSGHVSPQIPIEKLRAAKAQVRQAVKAHKIFTIRGHCPVVRAGLRARGWVERVAPLVEQPPVQNCSDSEEAEETYEKKERSDEDELHQLMSQMVQKEMVHFYWASQRGRVDYCVLSMDHLTNHYTGLKSLTSKVGLCTSLRMVHWFDSTDQATFFPRCYVIGSERTAFIKDFRRTACTNLLKLVLKRNQKEGAQRDQSHPNGKNGNKNQVLPSVSSSIIETALKVCEDYLNSVENKDFDTLWKSPMTLTDRQWSDFLRNYYLAAQDGAELENSAPFLSRCRAMLNMLHQFNPQLNIDGTKNIWIIKPGSESQGRGIKCAQRLDELLDLAKSKPSVFRYKGWVVQKYVERPFLVHGTKVDLRQWFLVTDWNPLTIWYYKKAYVRFCTQPFTLDTLHRSVHLCNTSIQRYLQPSPSLHPKIPKSGMWCCHQFTNYLIKQGYRDQWQRLLVPKMKEAIIRTLKTGQDQVKNRRGSFQLFGADFLLGEDLHPWLIEINGKPSLESNTALKAKLSAAVQEDVLRVVLDLQVDQTAHTGDFELIYKQPVIQAPKERGVDLLCDRAGIKQLECLSSKPISQTKPLLATLRTYPPRQQHLSNRCEAAVSKPSSPPKACMKTKLEDLNLNRKSAYYQTFSLAESTRLAASLAADRPQNLPQLPVTLKQHQLHKEFKTEALQSRPPTKSLLSTTEPKKVFRNYKTASLRPLTEKPLKLPETTKGSKVSTICGHAGPGLRVVQPPRPNDGHRDNMNLSSLVFKGKREPTLAPSWSKTGQDVTALV